MTAEISDHVLWAMYDALCDTAPIDQDPIARRQLFEHKGPYAKLTGRERMHAALIAAGKALVAEERARQEARGRELCRSCLYLTSHVMKIACDDCSVAHPNVPNMDAPLHPNRYKPIPHPFRK